MTIPLTLAVEGTLDEAVLHRLLADSAHLFAFAPTLGRRGRPYLQSIIAGLNSAARGHSFVVLADLDQDECAPDLIRHWLTRPPHPNLILRVAVKEVEAWLLADSVGIAPFLGIPVKQVPKNPDCIDDPKRTLVNLARRSQLRIIRDDLVPDTATGAVVGPNYSGRLMRFVRDSWNPVRAAANSESLARAVKSFSRLIPST